MAKNTGILDFTGTLGQLTFYKTKAGKLVRTKSSLNRRRVLTDPSFANSRLSSSEFGRASSSGALIRRSFRLVARHAIDGSTHYRLNSLIGSIIRSANSGTKGERSLTDGDVNHLIGFQWNELFNLNNLINEPSSFSTDPVTGECSVSMPSFNPVRALAAPTGATHFQLIAGASAVDFASRTELHASSTSPHLPITETFTEPQSFTFTHAPVSGQVLLLGLGILFYQQSNSRFYLLKEKAAFDLLDVKLIP